MQFGNNRMKRHLLYTTTFVLLLGLFVLYFFYPRTVPFCLAKEINKPSETFDNSHFIGFNYVDNSERLYYWMVSYLSSRNQPGLQGYDSLFVLNISKELDFYNYDYIIAYQKRIKKLRYSPFLTWIKDDLYFDKKTPLIPTWNKNVTDSIYLYRIKKNERFRAPGP